MEKTAIRVLLVEDNMLDARVITDLLSENRDEVFQVETADSLRSARERLAKAAFDAVIVDLALPDSKGLETLHKIVSLAPDIPIIVCSAVENESAALSCLKAGAQDYLTKGAITGPELTRCLLFGIERKRLDASREKAGRKKVREKQKGQQSERDAAEQKKTNEALLKAAEEWRATFDSITDLISIQDADYRIVRVNRAFADFYKMSPKELIGRHCYEVVHGMNEAPPYCPHRKVFETKKGIETEIFESGNGRYIQLVDSPIKDKKSNVVGTVHVMKDITERKRTEEALRENEAFTKAVLDNLPIGIAVNAVDPLVTFSYMNDNFAKFYRTTKKKLTDPDSFWSAVYEDPEFRELSKKRVLDGCASGDPERMHWTDVPITRKGQETTYISARNIPIPDKALMVSTVWDVTERKRAEEALKKEQQDILLILNSSPVLIFYKDTEGKLVRINKAFAQALNKPEEQIVGKTVFELYSPEVARSMTDDDQEIMRSGRPKHNIIEYYESAAGIRWVQTDKMPIYGENNSVIGLVGFAQDITERRLAEEALKKEQQDMSLILDKATTIIFYTDTKGKILRVNKRFAMGLDKSEEEIVGKTVFDLFSGEVAEGMTRNDREVVSSGRPILNVLEHHESPFGPRWITTDKIPVFDENNNVVAIAGFSQDITERVQAEEALRQSEERYRDLVENIDDIVYVAEENGKLIYLNNAFERLSGHTREEMLQKSYLDILTPESRTAVLELFKAQKEGRDIGVFEMSFLDKDRTEKTIEVREKRIMQGGRVVEVHGLGRDVTERKQALENIEEINRLLFERTIELGQSEEKFRSLFQTSRDFLFVADIDGVIIDANSAALEFVGYSHKEIPGVPAHNFFAQPEEGKRIIKNILENGQMINRETKLKDKNGEIVDALLTVVLRKNRDGKPIGLFGSAKDITEKRKLELQLVQTEKLSTVGTMISGVAHELNNPLTSIIGNAQLLARRDVSDDIKSKLNIILRESKRSAKIVAGLLAFAREHKPERSMVNVNDIVVESLKLREYDLKVSDLDVRASLSDDLPETSADPYQLQQVFINLINNARDALANKSGSALIIRTYRRDDDIVIEFEDNGPGIAEELIKKIFDPFFTTKEVGKGTGLGLSMAYGIIKEHGGTISAQSEPGKGAKFIVTIPIREGTEPIEETVKARVRPSPSVRTVLVVEDEQSLRELLVDVLTEEGFSVDAASAGDKAIKLLETGKYDVVISDIKMPGIGGKELYLYVEKHHPEIVEKIIFITGDVLSSDTRSFLQITNNRFIEKPFEVDSLVRMLNDVLST